MVTPVPPTWASAPPAPASYAQPPAYNSPAYPPVYPPAYAQSAPPAKRVSQLPLAIGGLVILCLVAAGAYFFLGNQSGNNGISFTPNTINCAAPVDFVSTLKLPASVKADDPLTITLDGKKSGDSITVGSDSTMTKQPDGSWSSASTVSAADVQSACASGGMTAEGIGVMTAGTHTMQVLDASGKVLASGSYTVTGQTVLASGTPGKSANSTASTSTKTPAPTLASAGKITFDPTKLSCDSPVDLVTMLILPASVTQKETLSETFDGQVANTFTMADDGTFVQQSDGSWASSTTGTAAGMATICAAGGINTSGLGVLTPGTHTVTITNANGEVLARGSYTVAKPTATPAPTVKPTPAPTAKPTATPKPTVVNYPDQVFFSTVDPSTYSECIPASPITSVSAKSPVYVTYVFAGTAMGETFAYSITKDGKSFVSTTPINDTGGYDCMAGTDDLSKTPGWGPGLYHFTLTADGTIVGVGDLTVK